MAKHLVTIRLPERKIQRKDVEFVVHRNGGILGTLSVSQGTVDWFPSGAQKPHSLSWSKFAALMEDPTNKKRH